MQAGVDKWRQAQVPGNKKKSLFALDYEQRHAKPQGARMCRVHEGDGLRARLSASTYPLVEWWPSTPAMA
jgi:hypothetical protein